MVRITTLATYVFVCDAHEVTVKTNMLISNVNSSLVSDLTDDIAEASEHFVCALLR